VAVRLPTAQQTVTRLFYTRISRADGPKRKIFKRLPKVGKSRASLTERLRGPDDRVSAQCWREAVPFRERLVGEVRSALVRASAPSGGQQLLTTPRGQSLTTSGRDRAQGEHSPRRRLPRAAWRLGTTIAQGRRMIAQREERRHPGQAARERIRTPIDDMRGLAAPARRGCTAR
jgi:hypothetical protein